jgi:chromosome segregation ATPase
LILLEREQRINEQLIQYQDSLREQISITARLTNENNEIQERLNDEIQTKNLLINQLQLEIDSKSKQIIEYDENFQTTNNSRVEKQLVKNILLSYLHTPIDKQQEVIPLLGALVGFTQEEYQKALNAIANNYNNTSSTSWLTGWLGVNSSKTNIQSETPDKVNENLFFDFQRILFFEFSHLLNY